MNKYSKEEIINCGLLILQDELRNKTIEKNVKGYYGKTFNYKISGSFFNPTLLIFSARAYPIKDFYFENEKPFSKVLNEAIAKRLNVKYDNFTVQNLVDLHAMLNLKTFLGEDEKSESIAH